MRWTWLLACAETADERRNCGSKEEVRAGTCPNLALCHAGLAGNSVCATYDEKVVKDCKGGDLPDPPTFLCCSSCPPNYSTNDQPCNSSPTLANSCNRKPLQCN